METIVRAVVREAEGRGGGEPDDGGECDRRGVVSIVMKIGFEERRGR
jgi:hypothetical protein